MSTGTFNVCFVTNVEGEHRGRHYAIDPSGADSRRIGDIVILDCLFRNVTGGNSRRIDFCDDIPRLSVSDHPVLFKDTGNPAGSITVTKCAQYR